jgi:class 3 adenylate cyclase
LHRIVVFADLVGSTALFESLGNARATTVVKGLTDRLGQVVQQHQGRVVKVLGDGIFAVFDRATCAVDACTSMHEAALVMTQSSPGEPATGLQIGMAAGEVEEREGDCYGDAVNSAARLADLAGASQTLAAANAVGDLGGPYVQRLVSLDRIQLRGKSEATHVYRVIWETEAMHDMTMLVTMQDTPKIDLANVELTWSRQRATVYGRDTPFRIGRTTESRFVISDPRVSRSHVQIDYRAGKFYVVDLSSNGTWVRFAETATELGLKRDECMLVGSGELSLGLDFSAEDSPRVRFKVNASQL